MRLVVGPLMADWTTKTEENEGRERNQASSDRCGQKKVGGRKPSEAKRVTNSKIGGKTRHRSKILKSAAARRSVSQRIRATAKRPWQLLCLLAHPVNNSKAWGLNSTRVLRVDWLLRPLIPFHRRTIVAIVDI